mmetsp:Transcript_1901/g.4348  ORF Transcript_1901/g.4348 Transcript_1901/m.4348 type:complete len:266 (+) Transcript_1901:930-1727(+)
MRSRRTRAWSRDISTAPWTSRARCACTNSSGTLHATTVRRSVSTSASSRRSTTSRTRTAENNPPPRRSHRSTRSATRRGGGHSKEASVCGSKCSRVCERARDSLDGRTSHTAPCSLECSRGRPPSPSTMNSHRRWGQWWSDTLSPARGGLVRRAMPWCASARRTARPWKACVRVAWPVPKNRASYGNAGRRTAGTRATPPVDRAMRSWGEARKSPTPQKMWRTHSSAPTTRHACALSGLACVCCGGCECVGATVWVWAWVQVVGV